MIRPGPPTHLAPLAVPGNQRLLVPAYFTPSGGESTTVWVVQCLS